MKKILIYIIKLYQKIPSSLHNNCRHMPSCSNYGIEAINYYGAIKGSWLTFKRILRCNPWGSLGYDPLIKEERK